jgi:hypothetical protein
MVCSVSLSCLNISGNLTLGLWVGERSVRPKEGGEGRGRVLEDRMGSDDSRQGLTLPLPHSPSPEENTVQRSQANIVAS